MEHYLKKIIGGTRDTYQGPETKSNPQYSSLFEKDNEEETNDPGVPNGFI